MKTRLQKMAVVLAVMNAVLGIGSQAFAADVTHLYHNVDMENGKVVRKYIYTENKSCLTPFMRQLFTYNTDGNVQVKTIQTWNNISEKWVNEKVYEYSYEGNTTTIVLSGLDKKGNKTPISKYSYTTDDKNSSNLLCSSMYSWDKKNSDWTSTGSDALSVDYAILAETK